MKNVFVTGGAGYIGSHICKELKKRNYNPITFDNLSEGSKEAVQWGPLYVGNLLNKHSLEKAFEKYLPIAVMHFAANALVKESVDNPQKYYQNNLLGSLNLLDTMKKFDVDKIIFSSSCATYGNPLYLPIDENHPQNPLNPYGHTKFFIEKMLQDYSNAYGLNFISLRYFNAAGADFEGQIGENHKIETHLIPLLLKSIKTNNTFKVFGYDYPTKDGTAVRDYIHVQDLSAAHILALDYLLNEKKSFYLNLGTGEGFSVKEIIHHANQFLNVEASVKYAERRKGDPSVLVAKNVEAKKILSWEPKHSSLQSIIQSAWNWHNKKHFS